MLLHKGSITLNPEHLCSAHCVRREESCILLHIVYVHAIHRRGLEGQDCPRFLATAGCDKPVVK